MCVRARARERERERESKMAFYAKSTSVVISGRETDRQAGRETETDRQAERERERLNWSFTPSQPVW